MSILAMCRRIKRTITILLYLIKENRLFEAAKSRVFRTISVRKIDEEMCMSRMNIIRSDVRRIKNSYKKSEQELT